MKRMAWIAIASVASGVAAAAPPALFPHAPPGLLGPRGPAPLTRPMPLGPPRVEFHTDMPMDLVWIIAPNAQNVGALPAMPRAEVRIVAPNAHVREYVTPMPIIMHGSLAAVPARPSVSLQPPEDRRAAPRR
jgi:hypothetical protein